MSEAGPDRFDMEKQQDSSHWYVIQTKPGAEHRVQTHFINQGIEVFLPLLKTFQDSSGKMVMRIKAFFPNYLFVKVDLSLHYSRVKWTRGVNKILGTGDRSLPVSEKIVQAIKARTGNDNLITLEEWEQGDTVRIVSGPFRELSGIFQKKMSDHGRVRILLNLLGADVPVEIPRWHIKKVA